MSSRRAAAVAALCLAGCTFDYDGILEAAEDAPASGATSGGGGEDAAASNASGSGVATSTASTGAVTSSSSSVSSTSTGAPSGGGGTGGAGEGGSAAGGAAAGGGGGEGPVDLPSCAGVALDFEQENLQTALGAAWEVIGEEADVLLDGGELNVDVEGELNTGIRTVAAVLFECSIAVTLTELSPFGDSEDTVSVALSTAVAEMQIATGSGPNPYCSVITGLEVTGDCLDSGGALELRVRHTGSEICFDVATQGNEPQPTGECVPSTQPQQLSITLGTLGDADAYFDDVR